MVVIRRIVLIVFLGVVSVNIHAQEMLGLINSNYSGSNSVLINPSAILSSKLYADVNIVTANIFADNNFLYIHKEDYNLGLFLKKGAEFPEYGDDNQSFDYYKNIKLKRFYTNLRVVGPSAFVVYNDWAFALQTQVRTVASGYRLPYDIATFGYNGLNYPPQFNTNYNNNGASVAGMMWGEIGISVAKTVHQWAYNKWSVGGTVKYLMGYSGAFVEADNLDYIVYNDSTTNVLNLNGKAGYSLPVDYGNNEVPIGPTFKGSGVAFDLGVTYVRTKNGHSKEYSAKICEQVHQDYLYKIGFSILDLGAINFNTNAQLHEYDNVNHYWERIDTLSYSSINDLAQEISTRFYGNPDASLTADKVSIGLPAALSFQIDYHHYKQWYINGTFIYPIYFNNTYLKRPPQIALIPRYESSALEVNLPVSFYNFEELRLGLAVRFYFLTIGTDKLGSFFGLSDFTGADFYFSLKINLGKGWCGFGKKVTSCYNNEYGTYKKKRR